MLRSSMRLARYALVLLPTLALGAGGWVVTTVDDLPDHLVAGRATTLAFTVRGHGKAPIERLAPSLEAVSGSHRLRIAAAPSGRSGHYAAQLTVPAAGEWSVTIRTGFGPDSVALVPLAAVAPGATAPALPEAERGRRLFVAKGCVTCHVRLEVGPRLAGRQYDPAWLARFIADPQRVRPAPPGRPMMPTLGLDAREIASLVAYVNTGAVAAR